MFENVPPVDFSLSSGREQFQTALNEVEKLIQSEKFYSAAFINGDERRCEHGVNREDPSNPDILVGINYFAGPEDVRDALTSLSAGTMAWARTAVEERAEIIRKAALIMIERRLFLAALIVREAGKPWAEADADVVEAIDFCNYYAELVPGFGNPNLTQTVMGEENHIHHVPRGMAAIIAPWNFPLAIACGMTVAALVTGNATILKPAEQTSLIAFEFAKILLEAGVPKNAFAFLPGYGEIIGKELVSAKEIDIICFTGSKAVGLEIIKSAAVVQDGQVNVKKVIAEMGGKNAIIIDDDADLDEAINGITYSAFGFAGQKCSACSRVIAVGDAYEPLMKRLADACSDLIIGSALDPGTIIGPVIDEEAASRIAKFISEVKSKSTIAYQGEPVAPGHFIPPIIFRDVESDSRIWREEIFGPVLACRQAQSIEQAIEFANDSQYALTGGLFSRSPNHIELTKRDFNVGNLYVNRGCTGAIVCRQPFGGHKMSGIGSKAGGADYLLQFMHPRTITENTMRRGCAPEIS